MHAVLPPVPVRGLLGNVVQIGGALEEPARRRDFALAMGRKSTVWPRCQSRPLGARKYLTDRESANSSVRGACRISKFAQRVFTTL